MPRLAITTHQLQEVLSVLTGFGFAPGRLVVAPDGGVTIVALGADEATVERDLLTEWEVSRANRLN